MKSNRKNRKLQAIRKKNAFRNGRGMISIAASYEMTNHPDSYKIIEEHKQQAFKKLMKEWPKYDLKVLWTDVTNDTIIGVVKFYYKVRIVKKLYKEPLLNTMERYFKDASARQRLWLLNEMHKEHREAMMNWTNKLNGK